MWFQFQKRKYAKLQWLRCGKKGYGLQLLEDISKGQFLIEYVGEVIVKYYPWLETYPIARSITIFGYFSCSLKVAYIFLALFDLSIVLIAFSGKKRLYLWGQ